MDITIKPRAGLSVLKPNGKHLATTGETVQRTSYWVRRLREGDVELITTTRSKTTKTEA